MASLAMKVLTPEYDWGAVFTEFLKRLNEGQDVVVALNAGESIGKAAHNPLAGAKEKKQLPAGAKAQLSKQLEKLAIAALMAGQMEKASKTSIEPQEVRRKISGMKINKTRLQAMFDNAAASIDADTIAGLMAAVRQRSDRLKQLQQQIETKEGVSGIGTTRFKKLPPRQILKLTLIETYNKVAEEPAFGVDEVGGDIDQAGQMMQAADQLRDSAKATMKDAAEAMIDQELSKAKQDIDTKIASLKSKTGKG